MGFDDELTSTGLESVFFRERLSSAELIQLAETLHECLRAIGIGNSLDDVGKVLQRGGDLEKALVAAVSQISSAKLEQIAGLNEKQFRKKIAKRRKSEANKIRLTHATSETAMLVAIFGTGYLAINNAEEFAPSIIIERTRLAVMAGLIGGSLGGAWGWNRGEDTYERVSYSFISALIVFLAVALVAYGASLVASKSNSVEVGVFTTKFLTGFLLLIAFVLATIHLNETFENKMMESDELFDTLRTSTESVSDIAFYLQLLQAATTENKFALKSLSQVGKTMIPWIDKRYESSQKVHYVGSEKPTLAEFRAANLVRPYKREGVQNKSSVLDSSYQLRFLLQSNGVWAYGVGCWIMQLDEAEYLSFKEALEKELEDVLTKDGYMPTNDMSYSRKEEWGRLRWQLRTLHYQLMISVSPRDNVDLFRHNLWRISEIAEL